MGAARAIASVLPSGVASVVSYGYLSASPPQNEKVKENSEEKVEPKSPYFVPEVEAIIDSQDETAVNHQTAKVSTKNEPAQADLKIAA